MSSSNYQLATFFKEVEAQLKLRSSKDFKYDSLKEIIPAKGECFFVVDLTQSKILHFGGMKKLFGYEEEHIDLPFIFQKSHPEDSLLVQSIVSNILARIVHIAIPVYTNIFSITSRFRKSNGEYLRILTDNFIIQTNNQNLVQSILVKYTDLSFLDESNAVDWKVNSNFLDKDAIAKEVYGENINLFTEREKEIVKFICAGSSNSEIADSLSISLHTVATHRKNIFSKSKCSNPEKLKIFCKKNGIFKSNTFNR